MCVRLDDEAGLENAVQIGEPQVLVPPEKGLYACRLIPELGGEIVGFDTEYGGLRRSGLRRPWQSLQTGIAAWL
jgi:beta-fructofuranosidase